MGENVSGSAHVTISQAIASFLKYLGAERVFSQHTIRAYRSDLGRLSDFAASQGVTTVDDLTLDVGIGDERFHFFPFTCSPAARAAFVTDPCLAWMATPAGWAMDTEQAARSVV